MGFESMVLGRVNEDQKESRKEKKDMEFIWKPEF